MNILRRQISQGFCKGIRSASTIRHKDIPSLKRSVPGLPPVQAQKIDSTFYDTAITKLPSGLRVASEKFIGGFSTVGVAINAGPRFEGPYKQGVTHFLTKLAFGPSVKYNSREKVLGALEEAGAIFDCQASHDIILYAVSCRSDRLALVLDVLSESLFRPLISSTELSTCRASIEGELDDLDMKPDPSPIMNEMVHQAAFGMNTLGISQYCPKDNIGSITAPILYSFMKAHFTLPRMVLTCVGANHDEFLSLVDKNFLDKEPIWIDNPDICANMNSVIDGCSAIWRGGTLMVEKDLSDVSLGPTPMPELLHLSIGLKGPSYLDPDFVSVCVLNTLMGGGGSFSAGGPGKGMYSRLYLKVLNNYYWMHNATASNVSYNDCGLFSLYTSCDPGYAHQMVDVSIRELRSMAGEVGKEELSRAKKQLQSMLLMNLEQRPVAFEDISRQTLGCGTRRSPLEFMKMIDDVTGDDIRKAASKLLECKPAVACLGKVSLIPDYEDILRCFRGESLKLKPNRVFGFF